MKKAAWKKKIIEACQAAGTYRDFYDAPIETLAKILEERDSALDQYEGMGHHPIISHTNKDGSKKAVRNPVLVLWDDLNKTALAYWRELGLTPSAYRRLTGEEAGLKPEKKSPLAEALEKLG